MKNILSIALILFIFLSSNVVFAWGKTGHRTIGTVATEYLTSSTLESVNKLLDNQSLAFVSTYPDELKSDSRFDSYKP